MGIESIFTFGMVGLFGVLSVWVAWWNFFGGGKVERERQAQLSAQRGPKARAKGWRYDDGHDGDIRYRIRGVSPGGLSWVIEYDSDHSSSSSSPKLFFRVPSLKQEEMRWQVLDRMAFGFLKSGPGNVVAKGIMFLASSLGAGMREERAFLDAAREQRAGTAKFKERFVLFGLSAKDAALIDAEVERLILNWPQFKPSFTKPDNCFSATLATSGLEVKIACDGPSFEVIEHLAKLGQILADRVKAQT